MQYCRLLTGERRHIGLAPQPFDIDMASHDAGSRARYVSQYAIVWLSVPPDSRRCRIAHQQLRRQAEPRQIAARTLETHGIAVDGSDGHFGKFVRMCGLAAGRSTGFELTLPWVLMELVGGQLRTVILHRNAALGETRQFFNVQRPLQHKRLTAEYT